jgi:hypothetical protein
VDFIFPQESLFRPGEENPQAEEKNQSQNYTAKEEAISKVITQKLDRKLKLELQ